jgi:ankyrin repeat protein
MNEFGYRLRDAAESGKLDKVIRELENGTPVDCTSYSSGKSALHLAAAGGHADVVKVLLERGASVEAKDAGGETPLHLAVIHGVCVFAFLLLLDCLHSTPIRACKLCGRAVTQWR